MQRIPLKPIPNQAFTIVLDETQWAFTIKETNGVTSVSLTRDNEVILSNTRAVANSLIIPYRYLEAGNFLFLTQNFELPNYSQFGTTQVLIYITAEELTESRVAPAYPITSADFDPIAALPLRFAPQGYTIA